MSKPSLLPDKPSELLLVALADLARIEHDPKYRINMYAWHTCVYNWEKNDGSSICEVCLGGAVMVKTLGLDSFPDVGDLANKLYALDSFRQGYISQALGYLEVDMPETLPDNMQDDDGPSLDFLSNTHRAEWKQHMATLVGMLQAEGL